MNAQDLCIAVDPAIFSLTFSKKGVVSGLHSDLGYLIFDLPRKRSER
jgi:hypothetical protein